MKKKIVFNAILNFFGFGKNLPEYRSRVASELYKRHSKGELIDKSSVTSSEHDALSRMLIDKSIEEKMAGWGNIPKEIKNLEKTDMEQVEEIINGGFEREFGMTFGKFQKVYRQLVEEYPEKFI